MVVHALPFWPSQNGSPHTPRTGAEHRICSLTGIVLKWNTAKLRFRRDVYLTNAQSVESRDSSKGKSHWSTRPRTWWKIVFHRTFSLSCTPCRAVPSTPFSFIKYRGTTPMPTSWQTTSCIRCWHPAGTCRVLQKGNCAGSAERFHRTSTDRHCLQFSEDSLIGMK
jgi:hypothetical protein